MISPARLGWLQLRRRKVRFLIAIAGVTFAVVLMFMQVGFRDALFRSAVNVHLHLVADLVLIEPSYTVVVSPPTFSRRRLYQALAFDGVRSVTPVYMAVGRWKNPATGNTLEMYTIGIDPVADVFDIPEVNAHRDVIRYPDFVLYDELSRPEYGPVAAALKNGQEISTEISQRQITVKGLFQLGTSFGIDGSVLTSDLNFFRLFPYRKPGSISLGLIRLEPGRDPLVMRDRIAAALPNDVQVLTKSEYIDREIGHWMTATPIGYVFTLGGVIGLVVGAIIVYQILFADIADHLAEYATLKAMGYANRYVAAVVVVQAFILAVAGYLPGLIACLSLYRVVHSATKLPMQLTPERGAMVLGLTTFMCAVSGLIAMRKLHAADPAEIF